MFYLLNFLGKFINGKVKKDVTNPLLPSPRINSYNSSSIVDLYLFIKNKTLHRIDSPLPAIYVSPTRKHYLEFWV